MSNIFYKIIDISLVLKVGEWSKHTQNGLPFVAGSSGGDGVGRTICLIFGKSLLVFP
jgi:hypothetical protein